MSSSVISSDGVTTSPVSAAEKMKITSLEGSATQSAEAGSSGQNTATDIAAPFQLAMPVASILAGHHISTEPEQQSESAMRRDLMETLPAVGMIEIAEDFDSSGQPISASYALVQHVEPDASVAHDEQGGSGILDSQPATHVYLTFQGRQSPTPDLDDEDNSDDPRCWYSADYLRRSSDSGDSDSELGDELRQEDFTAHAHQQGSSNQLPSLLGLAQQEYFDSPPEAAESTAPSGTSMSPTIHRDPSLDEFDDNDSVISFKTASSDETPEVDNPVDGEDALQVRHWIFLADGGIVRISPPVSIVSVKSGKPNKVVGWSEENTGEFLWTEIIQKRRAITSIFRTIGHQMVGHRGLDWILDYAAAAAQQSFPDADFYHDIQAVCSGSTFSVPSGILDLLYSRIDKLEFHFLASKPLAPCNPMLEEKLADGTILMADQHHLTVSQWIKVLYMISKLDAMKVEGRWSPQHLDRPPATSIRSISNNNGAMVDEWEIAEHVKVPQTWDHYQREYDLQHFDWRGTLGLSPDQARDSRDSTYRQFRNVHGILPHRRPLGNTRNAVFFVPKEMHTTYKASAPHFQLRNLMAVQDHLHLVYSSDRFDDQSKVYRLRPWNSERECIMDLSKTSNETVYVSPVRVTTLALSQDYPRSICMIGGFDGEYALRRLASQDTSTVVGFATRAPNGIINHCDIPYSGKHAYHAVLSCNDNQIRVLDIETNTFLHNPTSGDSHSGQASGHSYPWPINCTSTSPDGRLRVVVGDTPDVTITNAETGRCERLLKGHYDFGFACAWSPDGTTVATANQDCLVNIYDTRTWRTLKTFEAHGPGCYRSMKFSPVGGGSKCLLLAESADRVTAVNATNYNECQTKTFYGEVAGVDFVPDGSSFWVANSDEKFGGMMNYERRGNGQQYGLGFTRREELGDQYREEGYNEWIPESERFEDPRCVNPTRAGPVWSMYGGSIPMV